MLQVLQYQKSGEILIEEVPAPSCMENGILVRNLCSLISAGTEKISVSNTQSPLLQRARKQPEQVKTVLDTLKKEGLVSTIKKVQSKLDSFKTLGYSSAGIVVESRADNFSPGDLVACAGAGYAVHAETVSIPKNLAARIPAGVSPEEAAYTTLGTIALQGVRQSGAVLGDTVAVIGLGLIGQITVQLLKASGCRVAGLDINEALFQRAKFYGCDEVFPSSNESIESILSFSRGIGCDSVIVTASTESDQPMNLALKLARKKGNVVVVGAVPMNIPRSPFYEKELDLKISCSYGPGRYDPVYEQDGIDYPPAYVKWTENRNMQAFLDLIAAGKMDVKSMTSHRFEIINAGKAYDIITGKVEEDFLGILIDYPERKEALDKTVVHSKGHAKTEKVTVAFVGAGSFATSYLIPPLKDSGAGLVSVSTETPVNARTAANQFGFTISSTDSSEIIKSEDINTVFCATRHDTHARFVLESLKAGKAVFVEKPLCVTKEQLNEISSAVESFNGRVMVGFNRRFSGPLRKIAEFFKGRTGPMSMIYRVNAGKLPRTHWVYSEENRGRIIGEVCHFIDCMVYICGSLPTRVYAESQSSPDVSNYHHDNVVINLKFEDGSIGSVQYFSNGDKSVAKEYYEVYCEQATAIMKDFRSLELSRGGKTKKISFDGKKGHSVEVKEFVDSVKAGIILPITFEEIKAVTAATLAIEESLQKASPINI